MAPAPASAGSPRAVAGTPPSSAGRGGGSRGRRGGAPGGASRPRGAAPSSASPPRAHARGPGRGAGERRGAGEGPGASQGGHAVPLSRGGRAGPGGRRRAPVAAVTRVRARVPLPSASGGGGREEGTRASAWPLRSPFLPRRVGSTSRPGGTWPPEGGPRPRGTRAGSGCFGGSQVGPDMVWKGGLQTAGRAPRSPGALTWIPSSFPHLAWDSRKVSVFYQGEKVCSSRCLLHFSG